MDVMEVSMKLLRELEDMGFPKARAVRALHHSGNNGLEGAINWIVDHENDPDIDQMPMIALTIDIESPEQIDSPTEQQAGSESPEHVNTREEHVKDQALRNQALKKEKDEKKMERDREKERIRAGKEILESKRVAEENERKRNIASRKAEKEEENRARDNIRRKLESDKAERRRALGLPPAVQTATNAPGPAAEERKNYVPVVLRTKTEQLRECLRSLRRNNLNNDAAVKRAFLTLLTYVGNVARNPDVEKFRKIRVGNPLFQERVGRLKGGMEFLELCGFERANEDKFLILPRDKVDMPLLNSAGSVVKSAMSNPYFGLLSYGLND